MSYKPIHEYGLIGNMRTAALVATDGSIDWFCFPHFDSPSVFAALLDDNKGGRFRIAPVGTVTRYKQLYWPDTNVLVTRFLTSDGIGEIQDFMPVGMPESQWLHQLIRRVKVSRGTLRLKVECHPAFDYARAQHRTSITPHGAHFEAPKLALELATNVPLKADDQGASGEFTLRAGEEAAFVLRPVETVGTGRCPSPQEAQELFDTTVKFWRHWISKCTYGGRWREMVHRSALTLKLLTFEPTGAIVAAPTCSLPEAVGGTRNWDYRYSWIREAAFTVYGFIRIGFTEEAGNFLHWLEARMREIPADASLQIVYGIDGRTDLTEQTLDHLEGYRGTRPVRIGNAACKQLQLDIYGELMDAVYLYNKYGAPISYDSWTYLRHGLNWLGNNWQRPDEGLWEFRVGEHHFISSKLMCWVAFDRGLRLADRRSFPADRVRWLAIRDTIYEEIMAKGWSPKHQSFMQSYGSDALDASSLLMPLVLFLSPSDPRMLKTIQAINRQPSEGGLTADGLVYRYSGDDGLSGMEGTFNMCSFWLVDAMTRAGRVNPEMLEDARQLFERMLGHANHLGLYAEETGFSGEALGNFPQGFTHFALISAAFNLDRTLSGNRKSS